MGFIERAPLAGMDILRMNSVRWTQFFQQGLGMRSPETEMLRLMSSWMDSRWLYLWLYPFCNLIHPKFGLRMLFTIVTTDWIVHVLKCLCPDDRPFWWFPLSEYSKGGASETTMYEFPDSCQEVTSAFPSTHSAIFAAASYVILIYLRSTLKNQKISNVWCILADIFICFFFIGVNLAGVVSRILLATSFHYQLFAGILIGILVGKLSFSREFDRLYFNQRKGVMWYCAALSVSLIVVCIKLYMKNEDPFWTVPLALNWCWSTAYVYFALKRNILYYGLRIFGTSLGYLVSSYVYGVQLPLEVCPSRREKVLLGALYAMEIGVMSFLWREMEGNTIATYLPMSFFVHFTHTLIISAGLPTFVPRLNFFIKNKFSTGKSDLAFVMNSNSYENKF